MPWVSYGGDLGVFLGYGIETQSYGFRKTPYSTAHQVRAGWSFGQRNGRADYVGEFQRENRRLVLRPLRLRVGRRGPALLRVRQRDRPTAGTEDFYKVNANQFVLYPTVQVSLRRQGPATLGPAAKYTQSDEGEDQFINAAKPYGVGEFGELGVHGVLSWDGRDNPVFPRKGVFAAARGTYFPRLWDVTSDFGEVNGNVNAYLSAGRVVTLALRAGGKKVFGTYPYMEAASIGAGRPGRGAPSGSPQDTVRGYRARRYLGDASAWGNATSGSACRTSG